MADPARRSVLAGAAALAACAPRAPAGPRITRLDPPGFDGAHAIWGAMGQSPDGAIWLGVSADEGAHSAHLMRLDPATGAFSDRGDVLGMLARLGRRPPGEKQVKLHSRFLPMDDGRLWFTSTDEEGEAEDGSAPPVWGSHLWSIDPIRDAPGTPWRHHLAVPEAFTCAAGAGTTVWALGLWGHVLYRHDIASGATARLPIGAPPGHMSRNIVADRRGHAFVPRARVGTDGVEAELLEIAPDMRIRGAWPLPGYGAGQTASGSHGIVGLAQLPDGRIAITTGAGMLHLIGPDGVRTPGPFHPAGGGYPSSLFVRDARTLVGLVHLGPERWDWVTYDLDSGRAESAPVTMPPGGIRLTYGSDVRDRAGRFYAGGRRTTAEGKLPMVLRIEI